MACALDLRLLNGNVLTEKRIYRYVVFKVNDGRGTERIVIRVAARNVLVGQVLHNFKTEVQPLEFEMLGGGELTYMPYGTRCIFLQGESPDIVRESERKITLGVFKRELPDFHIAELP